MKMARLTLIGILIAFISISFMPSFVFGRMVRDISVDIVNAEDYGQVQELVDILEGLGIFDASDLDTADYEAIVAVNRQGDEVTGGVFYRLVDWDDLEELPYLEEPAISDELEQIHSQRSEDVVFLSAFLGVKQSYQNRGIGESIFCELVDVLRQKGVQTVITFILPQSVDFFRARGARVIYSTLQGSLMEYEIRD
jgi:GNAT superfamily N-acetyltransferase